MILARLLVSLQIPDFRLLFSSDTLLTWADHMELVVLSWYVLEHANPFILGTYGSLRFGGSLIAPFYGVVADRYPRKRLLLLSRLSFVLLAGSILVLSLSGLLTVWGVLAVTSIVGLVRSFDRIVSESIIPDIVGREQIQNGVALSRIGRDVSTVAGAVSGGFLLALAGTTLSYLAIFLIYSSSVLLFIGIKATPKAPMGRRGSVIGNMRDGLGYVRSTPVVYGLIVVAFIVNLTAYPMYFGLLAVLAKEVLETTSQGLGQLLGVYSVGAIVGSIIVAVFAGTRIPGRTVMAASALWHVAIIVMAYMRWFTVSLPVLFFAGLAQGFAMITMTMMILTLTPAEMRGRVLGLRHLAVYGLPLGLFLSGFVAQRYGVSVALVVNGVAGLGALLLATLRWPGLLRPAAQESAGP